MDEPRKNEVAHTEHVLRFANVGPNNAPDIRLYRAPTVMDGSGTHLRLPHRVQWDDLRAGDIVIALQIGDMNGNSEAVDILEFWRVISAGSGEAEVMVNHLVGFTNGEVAYDSLAGMVGADPAEGQ